MQIPCGDLQSLKITASGFDRLLMIDRRCVPATPTPLTCAEVVLTISTPCICHPAFRRTEFRLCRPSDVIAWHPDIACMRAPRNAHAGMGMVPGGVLNGAGRGSTCPWGSSPLMVVCISADNYACLPLPGRSLALQLPPPHIGGAAEPVDQM